MPAGWAAGLNLAYALYHGVLGVHSRSLWFTALCLYYLLLSLMRCAVVLGLRKGGGKKGRALSKLIGALFCVLSAVLMGIVYLSLLEDAAVAYGEIIMITIAAYTFAKIAWLTASAVRARRKRTPQRRMLQSIRIMEAAVSVLTLQRSMLVSFGGEADAFTFNLMTGAGVCLLALALGVWMMKNSKRKGDDWNGKIEACTGE